MSDVTDFLAQLQPLRETISVKVPSLNKEVNVQELTFQQQTKLLSANLDGYENTLKYINLLNTIILDNCTEQLSVVDRIPLILSLRKHAIGSTYWTDEEEEIDINLYIDNWEACPATLDRVTVGNISISLSCPTIGGDFTHISRCIANTAISMENVIYNEYIKFIDTITINDKTINFKQLKLQDCYSVLNALPATAHRIVAKFIGNITDFEASILTHNDVEIEIPPAFFAPS